MCGLSSIRIMSTELMDIQPRELKFVFEVKKQSSCSIQLVNNTDQYVAFKVKTTSPKKYCVRPNIGVVKPEATCDFTVTMQAQREAPPDMQCKDKFLIQSTVVPFGTTEEDIKSDMFAKDSGKYIEDKKLRVVLLSPPNSPVLLPVNGILKQDSFNETSMQKDKVLGGIENIPPPDAVPRDEGFKTARDEDESKATKILETRPNKDEEEPKFSTNVAELKVANNVEDLKLNFNVLKSKLNEVPKDEGFESVETVSDMNELRTTTNMESRLNKNEEEQKLAKNVADLRLAKDVEELKLNMNVLKSKLNEAERTITKLTEERSVSTQEKERLKQELSVLLKRKSIVNRVQVGYPPLFVVMVSLISLALGYLLQL